MRFLLTLLGQSIATAYRNEIVIDGSRTPRSLINSPEPHMYVDMTALPAAFDWRSVNATSFVSPITNQHEPTYCGSCWAFSAVETLESSLAVGAAG